MSRNLKELQEQVMWTVGERAFQKERTAGAKALRQEEHGWRTQE